MCANPEMMRLLAAELREEIASRRATRDSRGTGLRWLTFAAPAACVLFAVTLFAL